MTAERPPLFSPRLVVGLVVIAFGVLLLLGNLGLFAEAETWAEWLWPVGAFGLMVACWFHRRRGWALVWALVGSLLLLGRYGLVSAFSLFSLVVPGLLLVLGGSLIRHALFGPKPPPGGEMGARVDGLAFFGANVFSSSSQAFQGGNLTAVFAGCDVDLTRAATAAGGAVLDLFVAFGGITIVVPPGWKVTSAVLPLFAGFEDKSRPAPDGPTGQLTVRGQALFGGIEVKNG